MADNKDLVRRVGGYSGDEDGSHVLFDSRSAKYGGTKQDLGSSEKADKAANILNDTYRKQGSMKDNLDIWRGVTSGYGSNTHGQRAIEGLMDLMTMPEGADLISYDTEILGTAPMHRDKPYSMGHYSPTEIGFQHMKMVNGKLQPVEGKGAQLSMFLKPNKDVYDHYNNLISNISNGKWTGLTDDVRRTLSDLTLYDGDPSRLFKEVKKDGRRIVSVNEQAREMHPLKGSVLSSSDNIASMKRGLDNLRDWGTTPDDAVAEMNHFMRAMQDTKFAGYNVFNFDQPMMLDWLGSGLGKHKPGSDAAKAYERLQGAMSLNQVDGLHAIRTLYRDTKTRFGKDVTLETMKDVFGMTDGQAHHALSDVGVTNEVLNRLIGDPNLQKILGNGGKSGDPYGRFNQETLKVGDRMFGTAGMKANEAGEYDGVYRKKRGKLHSAYDMKANPIYRNATYQIKGFFENVDMEGKNMFGIELYNETDDLTHTVFRESKADLESAIHGHLDYVERRTAAHGKASKNQNADRGLRRYRKMFSTESGGGVPLATRMYGALDASREVDERFSSYLNPKTYTDQGMSAKEAKLKVTDNKKRLKKVKDRAVLRANEYNTDEFVRDFNTIKGRLEGEEQWVRGFLERIPKNKQGQPDNSRSYNLALSEFGTLMEKTLGDNVAPRELPKGTQAIQLELDGEKRYLNVNDADGVRRGLYSFLHQGGHTSRPNTHEFKRRYREMLMQLKSHDALDAKRFEKFYKEIDSMRPNESIDNAMAELANALVEAREKNSMRGALGQIDVEDPTRVRGTKKGSRGYNMRHNFETHFEGMANQALNGTKAHRAVSGGKKLPLTGGAADIMQKHDMAVEQILKKNNVKSPNLKSSAVALQDMVSAYQKDFHVQLRYEGKRGGLQMVLADKNIAESVMDGSIKDIMKAKGTAVVDLAHINGDGTISRGSQNRVARLAAKRKKGGYEFNTAFDDIMDTLTRNAGTASRMLREGEQLGVKETMNDVHGFLNRSAGRVMQTLSMNNKYANPADKDNMFQVTSNAANWVRGGVIDVSDMAEEWYEGFYERTSKERRDLWRMKTPKQVADRAYDKKEKFVQHMGMVPERIFQREVDDFANEKLGTNLGMHSVKDTHVANYLRSNLDIRELHAYGQYSPMARENVSKTVNYMALEKRDVWNKLASQKDRKGNRLYSDAEIERMLERGVVTERAKTVFEDFKGDGKVSYLNMRASYMNEQQLADRAKELRGEYLTEARQAKKAGDLGLYKEMRGYADEVKHVQKVSAYDGMFIMSKEAGQAFNTQREKSIKLAPGEVLPDELKQLLSDTAFSDNQQFDMDKNITFNRMSQLDRVHDYAESDGKQVDRKTITVADIVRQNVEFDEAGEMVISKSKQVGQSIDSWNLDRFYLKGWNADTQSLVVEERIREMDTSKHITDAGDRLTAQLKSERVVSDLGGAAPGERIQAIMPSFETSKGMWGGELRKVVELAVDEAKAQIDGTHTGRLTAGSIGKADALARINDMFIDSFGIKDKSLSAIQKGQIVVDNYLGTDGKEMEYNLTNVNHFLTGVDDYLGTDYAKGEVVKGNIGIGKQNVYDWENSVGLSDTSRQGIVTYGRKEVDMVTTRANQVLEGAGQGKDGALVGWLQEHMQAASQAQNADVDRISSALVRTSVEKHQIAPGQGDVVIRTTGRAFGVEDPMGRNTGRITPDGVREVSMHALNDLPKTTVKNVTHVAADYSKTIVDFGRAHGMFKDGLSVEDAVKNNGGTALLEMPDDKFAKKYIRLIDFGDVAKGGAADIPILKEIQNTQKQIWAGIKEYQSLGTHGVEDEDRAARIIGRVDQLVEQYDEKTAHMTSSARKDGIMKTLGSAEMDMAGRFRAQGVNPMASYEGLDADGQVTSNADNAVEWRERKNAKYKEGVGYVSKGRFLEMVDGAESHIADALDIQHLEVDGKQVTVKDLVKTDIGTKQVQSEIVKQMLDPENGKGLYGLVNRYPTIKQSTIQALGIGIDTSIADEDRGMRFAAGTAANLKADNDGDFLSAVLSHYKSKNAKGIHEEMAILQGVEAEAGRVSGAAVVQDIQGDMTSLSKQMNVTVGTLALEADEARNKMAGDRNERESKLVDLFDGMIEHSQTAKDRLETREARLGKSFVGIVDNTRDRVLGLATAVVDELHNAGAADSSFVSNYRNAIEEGTAKFSQDMISSKKFTVSGVSEYLAKLEENKALNDEQLAAKANTLIEERHFQVADMNEYLLNLNDENREKFVARNRDVGLWDVSKPAEEKKMNQVLDMIQNVQKWTAGTGGARNASLDIGVSEGRSKEQVQRMYGPNGDAMVPTRAAQTLAGVAAMSEHAETRAVGEEQIRKMDNWSKSLLQHHSNATGGADNLIDSLSSAVDLGDHSLSGATVAEESAVKFKDVASKFTPKALGNGGGFAGGAVAFGAIWAASAMSRSGPTPEGLQEQTHSPAPVPKQAMQTPTARVTENNGEFVNLRVSAKNAQNMSEQDVAALVHQELGAMTSMKLDTTLNVNDNTQNIDQQWLQGVVANAIDKGYGF